jgi:hypothetical protein
MTATRTHTIDLTRPIWVMASSSLCIDGRQPKTKRITRHTQESHG